MNSYAVFSRRGTIFRLGFFFSAWPLPAQTSAAVEQLAQPETAALADDMRPGAADFRAGQQAHEASDFNRAAAALKRAAQQGYPRAFWLLGILYEGGYGVPRDQAEARRLFAAGATKGDPGSMLMLGQAWRSGRGGADDQAQAKLWLQRALEHPAASPTDRSDAVDALSALNDVTAATVPRSVAAPQSLGTIPAAATPVSHRTDRVTEFEPPAFAVKSDGKTVLPSLAPQPLAPWTIERAWRQALAAAVSTPSPSYSRGRALVAYVKGIEASDLPGEKKHELVRTRVDELALLDFYALNEADVAFLGTQRNDFIATYLTLAQKHDLERVRASLRSAKNGQRPDFAGFPHGTGWAAPDLAAAARAGDDATRLRALRTAAAKGSPEAMRQIAELFRHGKGVTADPMLALRWMHSAAMRHHLPSIQQMADYVEQGVGLPADPVQARNWRIASRTVVPPVVSKPRLSLKGDRQNFTTWMSSTWEATLRPAQGKSITTRFRFSPTANGFTLHIDEQTQKPIACNVWLTERPYSTYDSRTYKVLNFDFMGKRFEGHLNQGALNGRFPGGTWSASRREDLDYAKLAESAHRERRMEDAIHYYTEALAVRRVAHYLQRRSAVYYELSDYGPAIMDLDAALALEPWNEISLVNRTLAHYAADNYDAAIADATQLLGRTINDEVRAKAVRTRALAHFKAGHAREAVDDFAAARKLNPNHPQTREEALAGLLLANQAINEAHGKMAESMNKLANELKQANEARAGTPRAPLQATEGQSPKN